MNTYKRSKFRAQRSAFKRTTIPRYLKGYARIGGAYARQERKNYEVKYLDTASNFSVDATGEVPSGGQLTQVPLDGTPSGRIGRKITVKSIQARGIITTSATVPDDTVYIYVVLDKQCNGAAAAITDVLTSSLMGQALINLNNSDRFVILKRVVLHASANAGVAAAYEPTAYPFECFMKCNIPIEYDQTASTGNVSTIRSNNIFLLAGSSALTDDGLSVTSNWRIRYTDF